MRSFLAALRTLILPYGATSGPRLILNGVDGTITSFGTADTRSLKINPNSSTGGDPAIELTTPNSPVGDKARIEAINNTTPAGTGVEMLTTEYTDTFGNLARNTVRAGTDNMAMETFTSAGGVFEGGLVRVTNQGGVTEAIMAYLSGGAFRQFITVDDLGILLQTTTTATLPVQINAGDLQFQDPGGSAVMLSMARGWRATAASTASSAATVAEAAVVTMSNFIFRTGRAYKISVGGRVQAATPALAQQAVFAVRRNNIGGTVIGSLGGVTIGSNAGGGPNVNMVCYVLNNTGVDIVDHVLITMASNAAGTVTHIGTATGPRFGLIEDCGAAANFATTAIVL